MKRIFSLMLAVAIVFSLATIAFAADATVSIVYKDAEGNEVDKLVLGNDYSMEMTITSSTPMADGMIIYEINNLTNFDLTAITNASIDSCGIGEEEGMKYISIYGGAEYGEYVATFSITPVAVGTASISIEKDVDMGSCMNDGQGDPIEFGTISGDSIEVVAAGPQVNIAEIVAETTVIEDNATTVGGEKTDAQIGAGVAFTVVNNSFKKMIWAITTADGTLYSQKSYPVDESGLIDGQLKVAATFINGTHDTGKAVTVEKVGAIFQDSEGADWYTDKAYADDKAE